MNKVAKMITKHKNIIIILAMALLFPAAIGYVTTRINYDILSYLPNSLETVEGQDIMVDEFGMGAFSMIIVEDMSMKDTAELEKKLEAVEHVTDVLWYDDALDISVPTDMMPKRLRDAFFNGDAIIIIALFDDTTSSYDTMTAITDIRKLVGETALAAVLQLAVTMDYSIFLPKSYKANKERFENDKQRAMSHAIMNTFKSVSSSSVITIAGFLVLCCMTFRLGTNIDIVMSKGVIIGVLACVTVLPAMVLTF